MANNREIEMTSGPLLGKLILFALPLAASSILQQLFNSADTAIVGHYVGKSALAAVGSNAPVINLIINVFLGLSLGANVVVANLIGQGRKDRIPRALHTIILVSLVSGIFLIFFGMVVSEKLLVLANTPENVLPLAVVYLKLYFLGMPFIMVYNFASAVLRSKGNTKVPLYALFASGVTNILLNLFFVIVFHMGVEGVGLATFISNAISALLLVFYLMKQTDEFKFDFRKLCIDGNVLWNMIRIGVPAGVQGMVFSFSNTVILSAINSFGEVASAGSAAALNYEYYSYFVVNSFYQTCVSFTSQNFGAGNMSRCRKIFKLCMICSVVGSGILCVLFVSFKKFFAGIYTDDAGALEFALIRLLHVETLEFMTSSYEITAGALRGMGWSLTPAIITLVCTCFFRMGWILVVFKKIPTFEMLMNVYPASWVLTGTLMISFYLVIFRKMSVKKRPD